MSGLALFRRKSQSEALVKAPSMDLIRSDNELVVPEPEEIQVELESEKLSSYAKISDDLGFLKAVVSREKLLHILKTKNFRVYDNAKVNEFLGRYIIDRHKELKLGNDIWWTWTNLETYRHPLPPRVVDNIKTIFLSGGNEFSRNHFRFFVSDITLVTSRFNPRGPDGHPNTDEHIKEFQIIPMKRKTEICFLKVAPFPDADLKEHLIIDAWRGPTFSDEEAYLPGQDKIQLPTPHI